MIYVVIILLILLALLDIWLACVLHNMIQGLYSREHDKDHVILKEYYVKKFNSSLKGKLMDEKMIHVDVRNRYIIIEEFPDDRGALVADTLRPATSGATEEFVVVFLTANRLAELRKAGDIEFGKDENE